MDSDHKKLTNEWMITTVVIAVIFGLMLLLGNYYRGFVDEGKHQERIKEIKVAQNKTDPSN